MHQKTTDKQTRQKQIKKERNQSFDEHRTRIEEDGGELFYGFRNVFISI
jgi:hypothetical protein